MAKPVLYIVIPCYNEEEVLPVTSPLFEGKLTQLILEGRISPESRILFVDDGSSDSTWQIISSLSKQNHCFEGITLSRNRGHQNALLAGLMTAKDLCDITISIDCDGQDDINAMDRMLDAFEGGSEVVYGVRSSRETDTWFKRNSAQFFYKFMRLLGADVVYNHADYRLMSRRVLEGFSAFKEVNLFLRGIVPLVGYRYSSVFYDRHERMAGESHYPLRKMIALAFNGATSLSIKPLSLISWLGLFFSLIGFAAMLVLFVQYLLGYNVNGWSGTFFAVFFMGGIQLLCVGTLGEYIGKIYLETKARPRFIIADKTFDTEEEHTGHEK